MVRQFVFSKTNLLVGLFSLLIMMCVGALFNFSPAQAEDGDADVSVSINSAIAISLTNCDSTDSSKLSIQLTPTPAGTFKSNCQTVNVNTNAPGYTLTAKASSTTLNYLNPTTITPTPTIASTSNLMLTPSTLTNDTWGFAVEGNGNFDSTYAIDNESNTYAQLPTTDTTIYQTDQFPLPQTNHKFFYGTKATTDNVAGTYATTITYTAIGAEVIEPKTVFKEISISGQSCAIVGSNLNDSQDSAYCWGMNNRGAIGDGTNNNAFVPTKVKNNNPGDAMYGLTIKQISNGVNGTCAIASNDQAYCWGYNNYGQLGNGLSETANNTNVPVEVKNDDPGDALYGLTIKQISLGDEHACVIAGNSNDNNDDQAYCWGSGSVGQLGNNSTNSSNVPVAVSKISDGMGGYLTIKQISVGYTGTSASGFTCAITRDDNAYCWGANSLNGALGNNSTSDSSVPTPVSKLSGGLLGLTIKQVAAGRDSACVIASNDQAYCWGNNYSYQLGSGSTSTYRRTPAPVVTSGVLSGLTIKQISLSTNHACVIASDDNAYCWGSNGSGQLGNGLTANSNVPVKVKNDDPSDALYGLTIKQIGAGYNQSCALASDDNIYCWGAGTNGQLGDGLGTSSNTPAKVKSPIL